MVGIFPGAESAEVDGWCLWSALRVPSAGRSPWTFSLPDTFPPSITAILMSLRASPLDKQHIMHATYLVTDESIELSWEYSEGKCPEEMSS